MIFAWHAVHVVWILRVGRPSGPTVGTRHLRRLPHSPQGNLTSWTPPSRPAGATVASAAGSVEPDATEAVAVVKPLGPPEPERTTIPANELEMAVVVAIDRVHKETTIVALASGTPPPVVMLLNLAALKRFTVLDETAPKFSCWSYCSNCLHVSHMQGPTGFHVGKPARSQ